MIEPSELRGPRESEPGYVYHATNEERLMDIARARKLGTSRPSDYTDQSTWPDGSTEKRNYFTPTAQNTWQFAPEEGKPVLLRLPHGSHPIRNERGTTDLYSTKPVPSTLLDYHGIDNNWHPVDRLLPDVGSSRIRR